jgi:hypothetical protein
MGLQPLEHRDIAKDFSYDLVYKEGNPLNPLIKAVSLLLIEPALVLVWGEWKTGKTDFALLMSEIAKANGVVDIVKTNIGQDEYEQIKDYDTLKDWLHSAENTPYEGQGDFLKLFLYDELNVHAMSWRSISKKNVGLKVLLPEVSKAKARMVCICQNPKDIDKVLKDRNWLKGGFRKKSRDFLGEMELLAPQISITPISFHNVPPSHIEFNPYETAPMELKRDFTPMLKDDLELQNLYNYAKGRIGARDIMNHPEQWRRHVRKWLRVLIENYLTHKSHKDGGVYMERKKERKRLASLLYPMLAPQTEP